MKDKIMFELNHKDFKSGIYSISTLKIFSKDTGCGIYIHHVGTIIDGKFNSFCPDDKLCKPQCEQNENCYIKKPCGTLEEE